MSERGNVDLLGYDHWEKPPLHKTTVWLCKNVEVAEWKEKLKTYFDKAEGNFVFLNDLYSKLWQNWCVYCCFKKVINAA